jgi:hypothetical protein
MTIHSNLVGGCRSTLTDYSISTACLTRLLDTGMAVTDVQSSLSAGLMSWTTSTWTFSASDVPSLVAEAVVDPLVLLHQPTDLAGGSEGESGGGDSEEDAEEKTEEGDPSETNAAAALRGGEGVWGVQGIMLLSGVGSIVAGAAMVFLR